jgi:hypothetical protein
MLSHFDVCKDKVNNKNVIAMLDLGATHSFMANELVRELDLWLSNSHTTMMIIVKPWPKIGKSMLEMVNFRLRNDN